MFILLFGQHLMLAFYLYRFIFDFINFIYDLFWFNNNVRDFFKALKNVSFNNYLPQRGIKNHADIQKGEKSIFRGTQGNENAAVLCLKSFNDYLCTNKLTFTAISLVGKAQYPREIVFNIIKDILNDYKDSQVPFVICGVGSWVDKNAYAEGESVFKYPDHDMTIMVNSSVDYESAKALWLEVRQKFVQKLKEQCKSSEIRDFILSQTCIFPPDKLESHFETRQQALGELGVSPNLSNNATSFMPFHCKPFIQNYTARKGNVFYYEPGSGKVRVHRFANLDDMIKKLNALNIDEKPSLYEPEEIIKLTKYFIQSYKKKLSSSKIDLWKVNKYQKLLKEYLKLMLTDPQYDQSPEIKAIKKHFDQIKLLQENITTNAGKLNNSQDATIKLLMLKSLEELEILLEY